MVKIVPNWTETRASERPNERPSEQNALNSATGCHLVHRSSTRPQSGVPFEMYSHWIALDRERTAGDDEDSNINSPSCIAIGKATIRRLPPARHASGCFSYEDAQHYTAVSGLQCAQSSRCPLDTARTDSQQCTT